jgi:hypothetical protein
MMVRDDDGFEDFFAVAEPRLRRALVAAYGIERGREAAAEALAYGWEHWSKVRAMKNPTGYLYRVGQSRSRARKCCLTARCCCGAPEPTVCRRELRTCPRRVAARGGDRRHRATP